MQAKNPLRIGYVLKRFPRLSETFILNEVLELERQGVHVEIFSLLRPPEEQRHALLSQIKANVTYLPGASLAEGWTVREGLEKPRRAALDTLVSNGDPLFSGKTPAEMCKLHLKAATVAMLARERRLEHLHAHFGSDATTVALLAGRLAALPFSFTAHARDIYHTYVDPAADDAMRRAKIAEASFVATVSEFNRRHLAKLMGTGTTDHIHRLYNGIDLTRFRPPRSARQPDLFLAVGRLVEKKGFGHLINACAVLRDRGSDFRCILVGDGPDGPTLRDRAAGLRLSDSVEFAGAMPQEELLALMARAGVMVLPCVVGESGDRDGLPTVLLEALAAGMPAVTTTVSGGPEIVEDGVNGYLVAPGDSAALADALDRILADRAQTRAMGEAGRRKAEELFDLKRNVATLRGLIERTARGHPAKREAAA